MRIYVETQGEETSLVILDVSYFEMKGISKLAWAVNRKANTSHTARMPRIIVHRSLDQITDDTVRHQFTAMDAELP